MMAIIVSATAADAMPTLSAWLAGAGVAHGVHAVGVNPRGPRRVLHESEMAIATVRDLIVGTTDGEPVFTRSANGQPDHIAFGFRDMAFGHALIAELVRSAGEPALGEPATQRLYALAARVAASDATVLVLGDTGTGKEGLSRMIHARSARAEGPFVAINCAALPDTMLEAMLFGHVKGSFTGAGTAADGLFRAAEGGTLMLDEIAELPLPLQAKLLRALQEREVLPVGATQAVPVDVRIVAACNRDLAAEVAAGRFRADLYWRLNVVALELEPLAERRQDVRAIAASMLLRHTANGQPFAWPTADALAALMAHDWPGNARELDNVLQRALLLREGDRIEVDDLGFVPAAASAPIKTAPALATTDGAITPLFEVQRTSAHEVIRAALEATGGHRARAAARLGISERTLRYRLAELRAA
ncbi:sigma-54 interaction domain-containing protein [Sphingomonas gilva]|nr:sigma 54-interacting transcriptional regulator [Sphingomonas gilva]